MLQNLKDIANLHCPPAIVVGGTWANGLGLIRSLGRVGVPVLVINADPQAIGFHSRYATASLVCPDPGRAEDKFVAWMQELGQALSHKGVVFLTRDQDVVAVSRRRSELEPYFHLPFAGWDVIARVVDKRGQYHVARQADVPLPVTHFPQDKDELDELAQHLRYPVILKPLYHVGFSQRFGEKALVAHSKAELMAAYHRAADWEMMVQELVPGDADRLYTLGSYLDKKGQVLGTFTGRKLRQHPRQFGTCRVGESHEAPQVETLGLRLLRALNLWGISQVEFKLDPRDNRYKLIEVNARSYQWIELATACGVNLPYIAYRDALGKAVEPVRMLPDTRRWVLTASDVALTPLEIVRGQTSLTRWLKSWRHVAMDGIFSWSDPRPGIKYLEQKMRSAATRLRRREAAACESV